MTDAIAYAIGGTANNPQNVTALDLTASGSYDAQQLQAVIAVS